MSIIGRIVCLQKKLDGIIVNHLTSVQRTSLRGIRGKMVFAKLLCGMDYTTFFYYHCEQVSFRQLIKLMLVKQFYGIDSSAFFLHHGNQTSIRHISNLVFFEEQEDLWLRVNPAESRVFLSDKYKAYLRFRDYYQRDIVFIKDKDTKDKFVSFCHSHPCFIVKPLSDSCGRGIQLINTNEDSFCVDGYLDSNPDGFVAEELIKQDEALSKLHPESVNTLRINTVNYGTSIEVLWPCLRIGCGDNIVDNAGAGGIFRAINTASGIITNVSDEHNHTFTKHPDTGIPLIGFKIPKWEDACELAKHLAELIPECHFVGWDLALTEKGWIMVEGNHRPYIIWQIATGKGIRKDFNRIKKRLLQK